MRNAPVMNTQSQLVLVSSYSDRNIRKLFARFDKEQLHYIIRTYCEYPKQNLRYRVVLEVREKTNPGFFCRLANLYELVYFALRNPEFSLHNDIIEGFDESLEKIGSETGVPLTIPFLSYSNGKPMISVFNNTVKTESKYQLVVTSQKLMRG